MPNLAPTFQCRELKQPKKERAVLFLESLGGPYGLQKRGRLALKACAMALSSPML
jgi:hypothetical protein